MEAKRGVMSCVFVIVWITMAYMVVAVTAGESGSSSASAVASEWPSITYEARKRRDFNNFLQYLKNHKPPLTLKHCSDVHVIEYLKFLDHSGITKVHVPGCPYYGNPNRHSMCACPLKQAWGSLYAMIARLKTAYLESGHRPEWNPFESPAVSIYLRQVRECQAKARGIPAYQRKKPKRATAGEAGTSSGGAGSEPVVWPPLVNRLFYVPM